ncbi:MAG: ATP-dependent DNA helicase RecG [Candidatus Uhrbacteria bacterium]|nr:ATP-dependent DNA helicase RecG [Candidatus Uhrbacteria bacterium]
MLRLDEPVSFIQGATPSVRRAWETLGIKTISDLFEAMPRRYDDYSKIVPIRQAQTGEVVTIRGQIVKCVKLPTFRKRFQIIRATIRDETGTIAANFFNQVWLMDELVPGRDVFVSGKITTHPRYGKGLIGPLWEPAGGEAVIAGKLAPVYGLAGTLVQKTYRRLVRYALEHVEEIPEILQADTLTHQQLVPRANAFAFIHTPKDMAEAETGRRRLAFEELLAYQLALRSAQQEAVQAGAPIIPFDERFAKRFVASLPFTLTPDQKRAVWVALQDMAKDHPMRRLLQGDVGSGKTVVAAFLAAHVARAGWSAALLAPTDILARQHAVTWQRFLAPHQIPMILVTRTDKRWFLGREERQLSNAELEDLVAQGHVITIGTHAILEPHRLPKDLALAIVDEQHRFGVEQREALTVAVRQDGRVPHFLSMTATPIPRSLALTFYGDLDVSPLREKPPGRVPVKTFLCVGEERERAYEVIRQTAARHERAFVVCALIDPSDALGVRSATEEWKRLRQGPLAGLRVGLLHGRLKPVEKEETMGQFVNGELDVLVTTAVIEVGVDVPEATVMAIEGAERFGLAQLHQFRGRVGRSTMPSQCFLMTDTEGEAIERLKIVARVNDGLALAEEDLKRRGSGDLLGTAQSGHELFQAARLSDLALMTAAREEAERMLAVGAIHELPLQQFPYWQERVRELRETSHLE